MLDDDLVFAQSSASSIPARAASTASLSHAASDASERVLGYALYDPKMSFTTDTGAQLKNLSYYKRSWTTGKPYSTSAIWNDYDHIPPSRRRALVRPDLAVGAMKHILQRTEEDEMKELRRVQSLQDRRQERLADLRRRHEQSAKAQARLGTPRRHDSFGELLRQRAATPAAVPTAVPAPALAAATAAAAGSPPLSALEGLSVGQTVSDLKRGLRAARREGVHGLHVPRHTLLRPPDAAPAFGDAFAADNDAPPPLSPSRSAPVLGWAGAQPLSGLAAPTRAPRHFDVGFDVYHSPRKRGSAAGSPTPLRGRARSIVRDFTPDMTIDADAAPPSPSTLTRAARALSIVGPGSPTMR